MHGKLRCIRVFESVFCAFVPNTSRGVGVWEYYLAMHFMKKKKHY